MAFTKIGVARGVKTGALLLLLCAMVGCAHPRREQPGGDGDGDADVDGDTDVDGDSDIDSDADGDSDADSDSDSDADACDGVDCDDGVDCTVDSCDGATGACVNAPPDADGDGFADEECLGDDCDDTDPLVNPGMSESCGNLIDDDCNGLTDWDDGCSGGDDCDDAIRITRPGTYFGSLAGMSSDYQGTCAGEGSEVVFVLELTEVSSFSANTDGSTFDSVIYLRRGSCDSEDELACDDDGGPWLNSRLDLIELPAGVYYLFVDRYGREPASPEEDYVVQIDWAPVGCGNGFIEGEEECDDGNLADGDACSSSCSTEGRFALRFDGHDDSVVVSPASELSLEDPFTVELWFMLAESPAGRRRALLRKGWSSSANYALWVLGDQRVFCGFDTERDPRTLASSEAVSLGEWHHIAMTYDGHDIELYLDGVSHGRTEAGGGPRTNGGPLWIGAYSGGDSEQRFQGTIDEVRISTGVLYEGDSFEPSEHPRLDEETVALWHFDEGSGEVTVDRGPARLRGLVNGAEWVSR